MLSLDHFLERIEKARGTLGTTRRWSGAMPEGDDTAAAVAAMVGYAPAVGALRPISRDAAALTLSFVAANALGSKTYNRPRDGLASLARSAFTDLSQGAKYYSNGDWAEAWRTPRFSFEPISGHRFDAGVIGWDAHKAFLFWVEED
jgi:hypothetical protein